MSWPSRDMQPGLPPASTAKQYEMPAHNVSHEQVDSVSTLFSNLAFCFLYDLSSARIVKTNKVLGTKRARIGTTKIFAVAGYEGKSCIQAERWGLQCDTLLRGSRLG